MKIYKPKALLSIFWLLSLISSEVILPLKAQVKWHEKLLDINNIENIKTTSKEYKLLFIEAEKAEKEERIEDLLQIRREILKIIKTDFGEENKLTGFANLHLGSTYRILGEFKNAEIHYRKSIDIFSNKEQPDFKALGDAKNSLGLLYSEKGLLSKAELLLEDALKLKEKIYGKNSIMLVTTLNNLGLVYKNQNLLNISEFNFRRALEILIKNKIFKSEMVSMIMLNLGSLYLEKRFTPGKYDYYLYEAESFIKRALEIDLEVLGPNHIKTLNTKEHLAGLYQENNKFQKAILLLEEILLAREEKLGKDHPDVANTLNNLATNYEGLEMLGKAEENYINALKISENKFGKYHPLTNQILVNLSGLYFKQNLNQKASNLLKEALENNLYSIQREAPFLPLDDRPYFLLGYEDDFLILYSHAAVGKVSPDIAVFGRLNKQGLLEEIERKQYKIIKGLNNNNKLYNQLKKVNRELTKFERGSKEWTNKVIIKSNLEKKIYQRIPEYKPRIIDKNQIIKVLSNDSILIEFQSYYKFDKYLYSENRNLTDIPFPEKGYLAILLKPNGESKVVDLGNSKKINSYINEAILNVKEFPEKSNELWGLISDSILDPLYEDFKDFNNLYISPDSDINLVPFAALRAPKSNQYLNQIYNVRLLTTGRELVKINTNSPSNKSIIIAAPDFGKKNNISIFRDIKRSKNKFPLVEWPTLIGTKKEGLAISKIIRAELVMGKKATEEFILKNQNPKILHIASHSYFFNNEEMNAHPMMRSGIVLAGVNKKIDSPNNDGYLTALEFSRMELEGTELVVISGCDSGRGAIMPITGDSIYGLKRAISVAGAKSSLLSLWKVSDDGTAKFMEYFYKRIKEGKGKSEALVKTKEFFRNHPNKKLRSPYIWAAFQLSGDWKPIKF